MIWARMIWKAIAGSVWGRIIAIALAGWAALAMNNAYQRRVGGKQLVEASKKAGKKANATNEAVRRDAAKPGAFGRLLKDSCSNC